MLRRLGRGRTVESERSAIRTEASPEIERLLEERGIRIEDIRGVIAVAEGSGNYFVHSLSGRRLACLRPANTSYWVEFMWEGGSYRIFTAYSHRMMLLEGFNMPAKRKETSDWLCFACNIRLELATIKLTYLEETFGADTFACPSCGRIFISEHDAINKMALAEKMLEDK